MLVVQGVGGALAHDGAGRWAPCPCGEGAQITPADLAPSRVFLFEGPSRIYSGYFSPIGALGAIPRAVPLVDSAPMPGPQRAIRKPAARPVMRRARAGLLLLVLVGLAHTGTLAAEPAPMAAESTPPGGVSSAASLDDFDDFGDFDDFDDFDLDLETDERGIADPIEPVNRVLLGFNRLIDRFVFDPITVGYRFVVPEPARRSVNRFFTNVNSTQSLVNDIFQLEWRDARRTFVRLVINSTAGIGGLFDPATAWGFEGHVSDFGQTLALAGVPTGPYLVLPLFGPSDARDAVGLGVDSFFHPTFFILPGMDALFFSTSSGFSERESHYEELKALEESSIDYYSALRSGFIQNREAQVWARRENRRAPDSQ